MRCPTCQEKVTKSEGESVIILTRYVKMDEYGVQEFSCKFCKSMIPMPQSPKRIGVRRGDK
jgi:hypothetical protein